MRAVASVIVAATVAIPIAATPPPSTLTSLSAALHALDEGVFVGSYTVTVTARVATTAGKVTDTSTTVVEVTVPAEGPSSERIVRAEKNGQDITAEARGRAEKRQETTSAAKEEKGGREMSVGVRLPEGDDARLYAFGEPACDGDTCTASYAPTAAARKEKGLATGRLAWRAATHEPLWIDMTPIELPTGAKELTVRIEFAVQDGLRHPVRIVTDGVGGLLFIKRVFHVETTFHDLRRAAPAPAQGAEGSGPLPPPREEASPRQEAVPAPAADRRRGAPPCLGATGLPAPVY